MSWLSEIEADLLGLSLPGKEGANMDARKRMARVIRELAGIAKRAERCDTFDSHELACPFCWARKDHREDCEYSNLSPDAKEVIEEIRCK